MGFTAEVSTYSINCGIVLVSSLVVTLLPEQIAFTADTELAISEIFAISWKNSSVEITSPECVGGQLVVLSREVFVEE